MTANKPMTGEQLDELMTVAVNMQRDAEIDRNRPSAMFAYAVQVAVLELRKVRDDSAALAAENAGLKNAFGPGDAVLNFLTIALRHTTYDQIDLDDVTLAFKMSLPETPATDAFLAEVRAQGVEMFAASLKIIGGHEHPYSVVATEFAAKLRNEVKPCPHCGGTGTCSDSGCTATDQMIEQYRNSKGVQP
ncbi:hypothetical protein [Enterobacter hormaechei]|uniref:hypothetical protein n=1 Tax=Enterobacter hormaechei TaxID=158836 RepID=UPI001363E90D|nr:hypothetical protein [Enterobacter hormaechei]QHI57247.1 hypothetical protein GTQ93_07395 [Enterobacter hormaechei]